MDSSPSLLRTTIQSFLKHGGPTFRILDTRARATYLKGPRLVPCTNIPYKNLANALFQLPPKSTAFAVLEASRETTVDPDDKNRQDTCRHGQDSTAYPPSGTFAPATSMLQVHGWNARWTFQDQPEFWSAFQSEMASLQSKSGSTTQLPQIEFGQQSGKGRYHFLFQPNPFLVKVLPRIEDELVKSRWPTPPLNLLRCLDLGCGAGRDMTYMVARAPNQVDEQRAEWSVVGIDEWHVACERAEQLARDTFGEDGPMSSVHQSNSKNINNDDDDNNSNGYASRVSTIVGRIDPKAGVLWIKHKPSEAEGRNTTPTLFLKNIRYEVSSQDDLILDTLKKHSERSSDRFDLIVMIRFLERAILAPMVEHWLQPGGFIVWSTFVADLDLPAYSKPGPAHRLNSKDEARTILQELGLEIIVSEISRVEDGKRSVANIVARKKK
ncbi:hypothetical protein CPB97_006755 [Podila verticillata]|nr:hypothetical protein CPB97_006755 [Podila verticillata]